MGKLLSPKLIESVKGLYMHWCPGCRSRHMINTLEPNHLNALWIYDGNPLLPTFSPSIRITVGPYIDSDDDHVPKRTVCHYFITEGKIEFCSDSEHELAGQTVDLPDLPQHITSRDS